MKPKIKKMWLKALRSGEYTQCRAMLKDTEDNFCCLGVLTDLYRKNQKKGKWVKDIDGSFDFFIEDKKVSFGYLCDPVMKWAGLKQRNPYVNANGTMTELSSCNDSLKYNFKKIADLIEENL